MLLVRVLVLVLCSVLLESARAPLKTTLRLFFLPLPPTLSLARSHQPSSHTHHPWPSEAPLRYRGASVLVVCRLPFPRVATATARSGCGARARLAAAALLDRLRPPLLEPCDGPPCFSSHTSFSLLKQRKPRRLDHPPKPQTEARARTTDRLDNSSTQDATALSLPTPPLLPHTREQAIGVDWIWPALGVAPRPALFKEQAQTRRFERERERESLPRPNANQRRLSRGGARARVRIRHQLLGRHAAQAHAVADAAGRGERASNRKSNRLGAFGVGGARPTVIPHHATDPQPHSSSPLPTNKRTGPRDGHLARGPRGVPAIPRGHRPPLAVRVSSGAPSVIVAGFSARALSQ